MSDSTKPKQRQKAALVAVWMPKKMKETLDQAVVSMDSDRSKYIRTAVREKLARDLSAA